MQDTEAQAYKETKRKARKDQECCECLGTIGKDEIYVHCFGFWKGVPRSFKRCLDCIELINEMEKTVGYRENRIAFEELAIEISNQSEPYFTMKFNIICNKRRSNLKIQ